MADLKKTIEILFKATDEASSTMNKVSSDTDKASESFGLLVKSAAGVAAAIAGIAVAGVVMSADFEREVKKLSANLGISVEEAEKLGKVAQDIFGAGFAGSIEEAVQTVQATFQRFGDETPESLNKIALSVQQVADAFGKDYSDVLRAVSTLHNEMGYSVEDSMDFVVAGYQKGLDKSGDFTESITEYGRFFKDAKAGPEEFFNVLEQGLSESSTLGTDKIADVFKEFSDLVTDRSEKTQKALAAIGIDEPTLIANLNSGKTTMFDAFGEILDKTGKLKDDVAKKNIIADLFGSPGLDIGAGVLLAMDLQKTKLDEIQGALNKVDFDDFQRKALSAWRTIVNEFTNSPIFADLADQLEPFLENITKELPKALEGIGDEIDFTKVSQSFQELLDSLARTFAGSGLADMSKDDINNALQSIIDGFGEFVSQSGRIVEGLVGFFEASWGGLQSLFYLATELALEAALAIAKGLAAISFGDMAVEMDRTVEALEKTLWDIQTKTNEAADDASGGLNKLWGAFREGAEDAGTAVDGVGKKLGELPKETEAGITISVEGEDGEEVRKILSGEKITTDAELRARLIAEGATEEELARIFSGETIEVPVEVPVEVEGEEVKKKIEEIVVGYREDGTPITIPVEVDAEEGKKEIERVKTDLEQLPVEQRVKLLMENETKQVIAQIEANAETLQKKFEWEAQLDIAEVEAAMEIALGHADMLTAAFESTGDVLKSLFGNLIEADSIADKFAIQRQIEKENELRERSMQLIEEQIQTEKERQAKLKSGNSVIEVSGDGLAPHLEMIMYELLEAVQIRANEEGVNLLLGLPS